MRQKSKGLKEGAEATVRDVRHRTRKRYLAWEKVRIVLEEKLHSSSGMTLPRAACDEGYGAPYAARPLRLTFLAPGIVKAILDGRRPAGLTARQLMLDTRLPIEWRG